MFERPRLEFNHYDFQRIIDDFTQAQRPWASYLPTVLEHILVYHLRQHFPEIVNYKYKGLEGDKIVFVGPPGFLTMGQQVLQDTVKDVISAGERKQIAERSEATREVKEIFDESNKRKEGK